MKQHSKRLIIVTLLVLFAGWAVRDLDKFKLGTDLVGGSILIYPRAAVEKIIVCRPSSAQEDIDLQPVLVKLEQHLFPDGLGRNTISLGTGFIEITLPPEADDEEVERIEELIGEFPSTKLEIDDRTGPAIVSIEEVLPRLKERLDPAGLKNFVIRALGNDRVEINMPEASDEEVEEVKRLISTVGQLHFRIVAHRKRHGDLIEDARLSWPNKRVGEQGVFVPYGTWTPVEKAKLDDEALKEAEAAWPDLKYVPGRRSKKPDADEDFPEWGWVRASLTANVDEKKNLIEEQDGQKYVLALWKGEKLVFGSEENLTQTDDQGIHYVLMYNDVYDIQGKYLTRAYPTSNDDGSPAVGFEFDAQGGARFGKLTEEFEPDEDETTYQLGVILDGHLRSAPNINQRITNRGIITGSFTRTEVERLVTVLSSGRLEVAMAKEPSSFERFGPQLGEDTIRKGAISIGVSLVAVVIFIAFYYRFAGLVAILALFLNLLFVVAMMVLLKATWTLPGLAGLVLTVGMSVDANVLIFERIREELDRGASLGMAIRNGYEKAFSTIFDSNTTTVLTAAVLFAIGTDQVKGFAVTLTLGIAASMFCALFVTRIIFDLWYDKRWLCKLTMVRILAKTEHDFIRPRKFCYALSGVLIVVGMATLLYRGAQNLDIDFTGGTKIGILLKKPLPIADVRRLAIKEEENGEGLKNVSVQARLGDVEPNLRYVIRTTDRETEDTKQGNKVSEVIARNFAEYLDLPAVTIGDPKPIQAKPEAEEDPQAQPDEKILGSSSLQPPASSLQMAQMFPGGQEVTIRFEKSRSVRFVKNFLDDVIAGRDSAIQNPGDHYLLIPIGKGVGDDSGKKIQYTQYQVAMAKDLTLVLGKFEEDVEKRPDFEEFTQFSPVVAGETQTRAIWAIVLSWLGIIFYVWIRFGSWTFGLAGVIALVHDVLIAAGMMAIVSVLAGRMPGFSGLVISDMKINLNTVAALLTLIGYSINDTIVVFDRIREVKGKSPKLTQKIVNQALNGTLSRTVITSLTTFGVVAILYVGGGLALHGFAFIMVVGTITGTYSSIFIASPVLLALTNYQDSRKKTKTRSGPSA